MGLPLFSNGLVGGNGVAAAGAGGMGGAVRCPPDGAGAGGTGGAVLWPPAGAGGVILGLRVPAAEMGDT